MARMAVTEERTPLSREHIVDVATALIEREGLAAFTMRSLGRELGVSAMAVYSHFASRDAVLSAVLERFMASMDTDPVPGERWDDTLRRTMTSIYAEDMAHPQIASIDVGPETGGGGLARHTEKIVNQHLAQGMPEPVFRRAWAIIDAYLTGFVRNAIAIRALNSRESPNGTAGASGARGSSLDAGEAIAPWQRVVADAYTDESFAHGIELIIQGVRGFAAPDPCEWYTPDEGDAPPA